MPNILIAYFSREGGNLMHDSICYIGEGNTQKVAKKIASYTGGTLLKIEPVEPYPYIYEECNQRAKDEYENNKRPPFVKVIENLDAYDVIYLGFPIWYRTFPRIIKTFLETYNLTGKIIKPFCTNEEGDFGLGELELRSSLKTSNLKSGLSIRGYDVDNCDELLKKWIEK